MKRLFAASIITFVCLFSFPHDLNAHSESAPAFARCLGRSPCKACTNCSRCKHCNEDGGSCGVCKPPKPKKP